MQEVGIAPAIVIRIAVEQGPVMVIDADSDADASRALNWLASPSVREAVWRLLCADHQVLADRSEAA